MQIVIAQNNYHIGNFQYNLQKIKSVIDSHQACDLVVFSELCLSGYYPYDLIDRASFIESQQACLRALIDYSTQVKCAIAVGLILPNEGLGKPFYNGMVVIHQGQIIYEYRKQLLPVYNIFDEARHFEPGKEQPLFEWQGKRIGFLICEDAWGSFKEFYRTDPLLSLLSQKPDIALVLNASPSNLGKMEDRLQHMKKAAQTLNTALVYVNQVGGNDEMVYDGQSFVLDAKGMVLGRLAAFKEDSGVIEVNDTIHLKSWPKHGFLSEEALLYEQICLGLKDYISKSRFDGVIVGLSGGIDSAVTAALAVQALGADKVKAVFMPTQYTAKVSREGATQLAQQLGIEMFEYPLEQSYQRAIAEFKQVFGEQPSPITDQNIQARIRGRVLMEYSNHTGLMVLSTGNKSEISVGYTTLYGDMTGGFNLIGDIYKQQVYAIANYINQQFNHVIPQIIIERPPTAELSTGQQDTDSLLPYEQLDPILKLYIEGDLLPEKERQACQQLVGKIPPEAVAKVYRMVDRAEFKRRQSAPIIRCQRRSFGWGRKMPISAFFG